jgi:hypothetical protein
LVVSTGAWIVPEVNRRLALIEQRKVLPDFAGVKFHASGAVHICRLLLEKGVQVEAGIWNSEAALLFANADWRADVCAFLSSRRKRPGDAKTRMHEIETELQGVAF